MKLTKMKYKKLEELMPIVRKLAKVSNYKLICTMFYIIDHSCKLGVLPKLPKAIDVRESGMFMVLKFVAF